MTSSPPRICDDDDENAQRLLPHSSLPQPSYLTYSQRRRTPHGPKPRPASCMRTGFHEHKSGLAPPSVALRLVLPMHAAYAYIIIHHPLLQNPSRQIIRHTQSPPHPTPQQRHDDGDDDDEGRMIGPGYLEDNLEHGAPLPERYVFPSGVFVKRALQKRAAHSLSHALARLGCVLLRTQCFSFNAWRLSYMSLSSSTVRFPHFTGKKIRRGGSDLAPLPSSSPIPRPLDV